MRAGFVLPGGDVREQLQQAVLAEQHGWDGVFVWEGPGSFDPWGLLSAISQHTSRIRLGTMLTPLPWRRPWTVASQAATLDHLSGGRAVLGVGLGAPDVLPSARVEPVARPDRARLLDEGIDLISALHRGEPHDGPTWPQFAVRDEFAPASRPVQRPRVPIWVVGAWPRPRSMRRVLRCDGLIADCLDAAGERHPPTPDDVAAIRAWLTEQGAAAGFDIVVDGETPSGDPAGARAQVRPWAEAGATWWLETRWQLPAGSADAAARVRERLAAGPPGLR